MNSLTATTIVQVLALLQGLIITPMIIKLGGLTEYGEYLILISPVGVIYALSTLGVNVAAKRKLPIQDNIERSETFYRQFWFHLAILTIILFISYLLQLFLPGRILKQAFYIIILTIIYMVYSQFLDFFRYTGRIDIFNLMTIVVPYGFIIANLIFYKLFESITIYSLVINSALINILASIYLFRKIKKELGFKFTYHNQREIIYNIRHGFPLVLSGALMSSQPVIERFIALKYFEFHEIGIYAAVNTIGSMPLLIVNSIAVLIPAILYAKFDSKNYEESAIIISKCKFFYLVICLPIIIILYFFGKDILGIYGNEEVSKEGVKFILFIGLATIFNGLNTINMQILLAESKNNVVFVLQAVYVIVSIMLLSILLHFMASLLVVAACYFFAIFISFFAIRKITKKSKIYKSIGYYQFKNLALLSIYIIIVCSVVESMVAVRYEGVRLLMQMLFIGLMYSFYIYMNRDTRQVVIFIMKLGK